MTTNQTIDGVPRELRALLERVVGKASQTPHWDALDEDRIAATAELRALLDAPIPSEAELIAAGLGYPFSKEEAVQLYYSGLKTEPITVLEAWDAIGHDIGCNPSKDELLDSLRNMAAICEAHGNDMPAAQPQGEPVTIEAVAVTRDNGDGSLRLEWLLEGGIAQMEFAGMVLFAIPEANELCDEDGSAEVYLTPPQAEQPAPVAVDVLNTGFYTTESGGGKYAISIGFRSMADMQAADAQLRDLLKSR